MAKNKSIKEQIKDLMLEHPGIEAEELYPMAPFKTKWSYFVIVYNQHKYASYPQDVRELRKEYPKIVDWIATKYEDTELKITEIAELLGVSEHLIIHIKRVLGVLKYPEYSNKTTSATVFDLPKNIKKPSIDLEVGDIIEVTKHNPVDLRDIFTCGKCEVIFKNQWHVVIRDALGICHSFNIQLFNNYIEYKEVSN